VERDTPENLERRRAFCSFVQAVREQRLVFIDESFCKTGMRREFARSPRGTRVVGTRPQRNWKTLSIIGAIRLGHHPRLMTHPGSVDGRTFRRFVRAQLVPWLRPGDLVVMDNLNMHRSAATRRLIERAGATPVYLPTYSPELNPIELLWAHLKRQLRKLALDATEDLRRTVRTLRRRVPLTHIAGWFRCALRQAQIN
jgi:transposase